MAKRSSRWGTMFIILLLGIIGVLGYILLSTPSIEGPKPRETDSEPGVVRRGVDDVVKEELVLVDEEEDQKDEVDEKDEVDNEEEIEVSDRESEVIEETVDDFTFEGGLDADTRSRIERIMNESQDRDEGSVDYEYLQGSPVLSDDQKTVYFMTATQDHSFVGVYEMVLDGYTWTRIYKREYDPNPEIAILRVVGRDGDDLVVLAGDRDQYNSQTSDCYFPILFGVDVEDGLLTLKIDEDSSTGLGEYELPKSVYRHVDSLYQSCLSN